MQILSSTRFLSAKPGTSSESPVSYAELKLELWKGVAISSKKQQEKSYNNAN